MKKKLLGLVTVLCMVLFLAPAAASPLTAKPDLVKNIGGTTFDIHIHFSETSRETFTDKVVRLIKNDSGDETA